jgi:hypothetical protein
MLVVKLLQPSSYEFKNFEAKAKNRSLELYGFSYDGRGYDVSTLFLPGD